MLIALAWYCMLAWLRAEDVRYEVRKNAKG